MKCIQDTKTLQVSRVKDKIAQKAVLAETHIYLSKSKYKQLLEDRKTQRIES